MQAAALAGSAAMQAAALKHAALMWGGQPWEHTWRLSECQSVSQVGGAQGAHMPPLTTQRSLRGSYSSIAVHFPSSFWPVHFPFQPLASRWWAILPPAS